LHTAKKEHRILLFGKGEEKRDHIYVLDVVRLITLCLRHKSQGTLNLATGTSISFIEVAQKVAELAGGEIEIECTPRANPITHIHFDITALIKGFTTFQFTPLEVGLSESFHGAAGRLSNE
jgi:nucleoside-diphosphate-sugar epimerase